MEWLVNLTQTSLADQQKPHRKTDQDQGVELRNCTLIWLQAASRCCCFWCGFTSIPGVTLCLNVLKTSSGRVLLLLHLYSYYYT